MKRGIFGGTFNPVHYGHLRSAEETRERLGLDRIVFLPCFIPPHKEASDVIPPEKRLAMLELAIGGNPYFEISGIELARGGKSYSVETLEELADIYGGPEGLYFIIGSDSFIDIGSWREYERLFTMTNFVVVTRPGYMESLVERSPKELLPVDIQSLFCYDAGTEILRHDSGKTTSFLETTLMDISSTYIRELVSSGMSARYLLPEKVERFIMEEGLYRK